MLQNLFLKNIENLMTHTYSEEIFAKAVQLICKKYYQAIAQVYGFLLKESCSA